MLGVLSGMAISSKKDVSDVIGDLFEQQQLLRRDFTAYMDLQIRRGGALVHGSVVGILLWLPVLAREP